MTLSARRAIRVALLTLLVACGGEPGVRPGADVVLVVIDTLRADALSCYGNERPTSPHLDALAAEGVRFDEVLAQAPNTATSHATLFTGLQPWAHRVANMTSLEHGTPGLPPAFETLAERFAAAGYQTAAFTDGGPLGRAWNLHQGFEVLEARYEGVEAKVDAALRFLRTRDEGRPLFLFVHTYQVHLPYVAPPEWSDRFDPDYEGPLRAAVERVRAQRDAGAEKQPDGRILLEGQERFTERDVEHLVALYHGGVAYTDHELGRLWAHLRERGTLDETIVAVTSDHGEEFGEHGRFGHVQLHRETLRVPLVLRLPGGTDALARGRVVPETVRLVDLFDTLLEAAGLEPPPGRGGRSLLAGLRAGRIVSEPAFAETTEHLYPIGRGLPARRSVRRDGRAFLWTLSEAGEELALYDLASDPFERAPLELESAPPERALVERQLAEQEALRLRLLAGQPTVFTRRPDSATLEELRALGYGGGDE